jgi:hypothetical protein
MIYRSNISAPDLQPHFAATTICHPRHWSMGHDVLSDAVYEPECGFATHDEAAILFECARRARGEWGDIGARMCWTSAHIATAGVSRVLAVDPAYTVQEFEQRARSNVEKIKEFNRISLLCFTSTEFFGLIANIELSGVMIDGNHDAPEPLNDARNALAHLTNTGVIVLHDLWGRPIREAVEYLMGEGLKCRVYDTPNGMAVCWRGNFTPPDHVPDPSIDWDAVRAGRAPEFNLGVCV